MILTITVKGILLENKQKKLYTSPQRVAIHLKDIERITKVGKNTILRAYSNNYITEADRDDMYAVLKKIKV